MIPQKRLRWACFVLSACGLLLTNRSHDSLPIPKYVLQVEAAVSERLFTSPASRPPGVLHVVIPHTEPNAALCRSLSSAVSLGYPAPVMVHTNTINLASDEISSSAMISELEMKLKALESFGSERDSDIVVMVNGHNAWFQIGPQVLLSRYFKLRDSETSRNIRRDLVIGSTSANKDKKSARVDVIMGSLGGMKTLLNRARVALLHHEINTSLNTMVEFFQWQDLHASELRVPEGPGLFNKSREVADGHQLHLTVDLHGDLIFARSLIDGSSEWINRAKPAERQTSRVRDRLRSLPKDIAGSRVPFHTDRPDERFPINSTWDQQTLLTTTRHGKVPAIILDDSASSESEWKNLWFVERLAELVQLKEGETEGPVAFADSRFWWPDRVPQGNYRIHGREELTEASLGAMCGGEPHIVSGQ